MTVEKSGSRYEKDATKTIRPRRMAMSQNGYARPIGKDDVEGRFHGDVRAPARVLVEKAARDEQDQSAREQEQVHRAGSRRLRPSGG